MVGQQSDEELMLAYGNGDLKAFETIYRRHSGGVFRYLLRQCSNASDAEELFQDVWTNLIRARDRYEVQAKFSTYLYRLAHNRVIDHYRRRAHNPTDKATNRDPDGDDNGAGELAQSGALDIEDHVHLKRLAGRLLELLERLPPMQREAFLLREEGGFSVEEIAEVTGVNPETAKSRLRYAVAKLRRGWIDEFGE
jgi:RNA polymerase sigma-70 factor (ECF subfamily)